MLDKIKKKYEDMSAAGRASIWFTVCYILQRGIQYISMPIYTRLMSTTEYGVYSLFLSWFNLICVFTSLNIYWGTFNKAMIKYEDRQEQYMSSVQALTLLTTCCFGIMMFFFSESLYSVTGFNPRIQFLMFIHLLMFPTLQYWSQKQRFDYRYKAMIGVTLSIALLTLVVSTIGLYISPDNSSLLIAVTVLVKAVICVFVLIYVFKKGKTIYNKEFWGWSLKMAVPLIPHYLSEILLGHADRLMIGQMCGKAEAGIYNVAYQISMAMTIVRSGIESTFTPWMYRNLKCKNYIAVRKVTSMITFFMGLLTLIFMLIGPEILKIAAAKSYYEAIWDMPAIMIGCFFIFVYTLYLNVEIYFEKKHFVSFASLIASIINIVLNYIFINRFGYLAAGYTTMLSYLIMAILHYKFCVYSTKNLINDIIDSKTLFIISFILIVAGVICLFLYDMTIVRYIVLMGIVVILYVGRRRLRIIYDDFFKHEL